MRCRHGFRSQRQMLMLPPTRDADKAELRAWARRRRAKMDWETLSATLVTASEGADARTAFTLGTPGGDQQDQWQLPALLRMLVRGWSPQAAVDAPTFHTTSHVSSFWPREWEPAGLVVEDRVGAEVIEELERRGHRVTVSGSWTLGRLSGVGMRPSTDAASAHVLWAAANPRGEQGYASGR